MLHNHFIDKLAIFNGFASGIALYPQVWAILAGGSVANVSLSTFIIILLNSMVWLAYAIHRGLFSLGIASLLNIVASGALIVSVLLLR